MNEGNLAPMLECIASTLWGPAMLGYFVFCGVFLSIRFRFIQIFNLKQAFVVSFTPSKKPQAENTATKFQALMTSLGASVGTGNIVGVSTAVAYGGPGALFWMWVSGFLGMGIKYTEGVLGFIYRKKIIDENGKPTMTGGPMYYIKEGLTKKFGDKYVFIASTLAVLVAFVLVCDSLIAPCMVQANAIAANLHHSTGVPKLIIAILVAASTLIVILGGGSRIMKVSEYLVPVMGFLYLGGCFYVVLFYIERFIPLIKTIFTEAFSLRSLSAGVTGYGMGMAMRYGFARGLYSNEAGMGTSAVTAGTADGEHAVEQGFLAIVSTFVDTIIVCTMTGLAVLISGTWESSPQEANLFAQRAFNTAMGEGIGTIIVSVCLFLFAYTSAIAWCFFGERFVLYIWGNGGLLPYRVLYGCFMFIGSLLYIDVVWYLADICGAISVIPNLIVLLFLSSEVSASTKDFKQRMR